LGRTALDVAISAAFLMAAFAMEELHAMLRHAMPLLILLVSCSTGGRPAHAASPAARSASVEKRILRVVQLTNEVRVYHGLAPLQLHPALMRSAQWMAQDMVQHNYLRHTDHSGREIDPRLPAFGYSDYREIGENIAGGQLTPEEVVTDWMRSPGHRSNVLNPTFREVGVAHLSSENTHYKHYWVQDFGVRSDTFPVVINNKVPETRDPIVHLYLYGQGWAQQMRFSNDRVHWSDWEPYQPRSTWTLNLGYGDRTVYAEVRGEGITRHSKDTVRLLASPQTAQIAAAVTLHSPR
jgi:uncharacterized protein YkwD